MRMLRNIHSRRQPTRHLRRMQRNFLCDLLRKKRFVLRLRIHGLVGFPATRLIPALNSFTKRQKFLFTTHIMDCQLGLQAPVSGETMFTIGTLLRQIDPRHPSIATFLFGTLEDFYLHSTIPQTLL